jgi:hypothetical protein
LSGLIRKANNKLYIARETLKLLVANSRTIIFVKALRAYTDKLPWSNFDGFPSMPVGNLGWGFSIFMLIQEGKTPREASSYGAKYLRAFPVLFSNLSPRGSTVLRKKILCDVIA